MAKGWRMLVAAAAVSVSLTAAFMVARTPTVAAATTHAGQYNAAIVYAGQPHVFSFNSTTGSLQHGWWDGTRWLFETLDGNGCSYVSSGCFSTHTVGGSGIAANSNVALNYNGQLHLFTYDYTTAGMVHDWWDGAHWHFEQLDGAGSSYPGAHTGKATGYWTSAVIYAGQLHVFTYAATTIGFLAHDWWDGSHWHFEQLDGAGSTYPGHSSDRVGYQSAAVVFGTQLQVFYSDATHPTLHHAWWDGSHWHFECLDGAEAGCVLNTTGTDSEGITYDSVALIYSGQVHVFYYDDAAGNLLHAWWNGVTWHSQYLDGPNSTLSGAHHDMVGGYNASLVYGTQLQVWTYDVQTGHGNLEHDWWDGSHWNFETLAGVDRSTPASGTHDVGQYNAAILFGGAPHVWSYDFTSKALFHAWWTGSAWTFEEL